MRRERLRQIRRDAAGTLLLALLCLALQPPPAVAPALASTIELHYEEAFNDVQATQETESEIKAAFLLRFPDFISWSTSPGDTLLIGVSGDEKLLEMLSHLVEQENQLGFGAPYVLAVTAVSNPAEAERCEILVLGNGIQSDSLPDLARAHKAGILTVGVWNQPREGTVIHLFREGSRVRFEISQSLAKEAGLMISSKLLNLAREQSSQVSPELSEPRRG